MSYPDIALCLKKVLTDEGKLESEEIQWMTIPDHWYIHERNPFGPMVTNIRDPIDMTMVFKGPYPFIAQGHHGLLSREVGGKTCAGSQE